MTVAMLRSRVSQRELLEWSRWYELNPNGDEVVCAQIAVLCSVVANVNRKAGAKPFTAKDFFVIDRFRPKKKMGGESLMAHFLSLTKQMGGKILNATSGNT